MTTHTDGDSAVVAVGGGPSHQTAPPGHCQLG
jgi:hypothetical protein